MFELSDGTRSPPESVYKLEADTKVQIPFAPPLIKLRFNRRLANGFLHSVELLSETDVRVHEPIQSDDL